MRPIQLKMEAFGPYRESVDLDFRNFGNHSIFLINGPTGSGKTTIFDAISYALFNEASGQMRDTEMMKSDFATDKDFASVELTFEMQNKVYRIMRSPKQTGPGERVAVRDYPSSVEFYCEDSFLGNGREANEQIIDLIGLDYGQFRQIVLLPQGEFRQLLMSNSRDKEKIFRNIFGTQGIQNFQEQLKVKRAHYEKEYKAFAARLEQSIESIKWDEQQLEEVEEYQQLKEAIEQKDYQQLLEILERLIKIEETSLLELVDELKALDGQEKSYQLFKDLLIEKSELIAKQKELILEEPAIEADRISLKRNQEAQAVKTQDQELERMQKKQITLEQSLAEKNKEAETLEDRVEELQRKYKAAQREAEKLDGLRADLNKLNAEETQLLRLEEQEKRIIEIEKNQSFLNKTIEKTNQEEADLTAKLTDLKEQISYLEKWRRELDKQKKEEETLKSKMDNHQIKKDRLEKIIELKTELVDKIQENDQQYKDYQLAEENYIAARQHYFNNLAGILAKDLVEEQACPVCGSTHHPMPASWSDESMSRDQLEKLEKKRNQKRSSQEKIAMEIDKVGKDIKEELKRLDSDYDEQSSKEKLIKAQTELMVQITELKKEQENNQKQSRELKENIQKEEQWRKELEETQMVLEKTKQTRMEVQKDYAIGAQKIDETQESIEQIKKEVSVQSLEELQLKQNDLKTQISKIERTVKELQELFNEAKNEKTRVETSLLALNEQKEKRDEEIRAQAEKVTRLLEQYQLDKSFEDFLLEAKELESIQTRLKTFEKEEDYTKRRLVTVNHQLEDYQEEKTQRPKEVTSYLEKISLEKEQLEKQRDQIIRQKAMLENSYQAIDQNLEKSQKILTPLEIYADLAEIANGSNKRTNYVSFERYLLSIYFTEILHAANERLTTMTNNRYQLVRREDKTKGRGADGLEIDVFDGYSGKTRSVKSLSGGETFKASLALALGLSDVIQSQKGGVEINTLFIDEGFGSLDVDSLEMAIETLMDLQASGRLIGVISHVTELKDRIPARIIVEKVKEGSRARIETD